MIELKILIDELDYDSIADYLIPALTAQGVETAQYS